MDRCDCCRNISKCAICGTSSEGFHHVGVRGTTNRLRIPVINYNVTYDAQPSGVWHYSQPCNHRVYSAAASSVVKYNGGALLEDRYTPPNIYWRGHSIRPHRLLSRIEHELAVRRPQPDPTLSC